MSKNSWRKGGLILLKCVYLESWERCNVAVCDIAADATPLRMAATMAAAARRRRLRRRRWRLADLTGQPAVWWCKKKKEKKKNLRSRRLRGWQDTERARCTDMYTGVGMGWGVSRPVILFLRFPLTLLDRLPCSSCSSCSAAALLPFASSSFWLQQTSRLQITHGDDDDPKWWRWCARAMYVRIRVCVRTRVPGSNPRAPRRPVSPAVSLQNITIIMI